MRLTFNFKLKDLSGNEFASDESTANKVVAGFLSQINKGNAIKLWDWALKLYGGKGIEVDDTDYKIIEGLIETTETLPALTKAQLLLYLEDQNKKK